MPYRLRLLLLPVLIVAVMLAACSGGEVTYSNGESPETELSVNGQAIADQWGTEMGRNGTRLGSVTVNEGRCLAKGFVTILGEDVAKAELDAEVASSELADTTFSANDADAMAKHWVGCVDLTDFYTDLGKEVAPFAVPADLACFASEMEGRSAPFISSVLQGNDPVGTISAGAAQACGLL